MGQRRVTSPVNCPPQICSQQISSISAVVLALPKDPDGRRHPSTVPARVRAITGQRTLDLMAWRQGASPLI